MTAERDTGACEWMSHSRPGGYEACECEARLDAVTAHTRTQTDQGPDYCDQCSNALSEWVEWSRCVARRQVRQQGGDVEALRARLMNARWEAVLQTDVVASMDARSRWVLRSETRAEVAWYANQVADWLANDRAEVARGVAERLDASMLRNIEYLRRAEDAERALAQAERDGAVRALREAADALNAEPDSRSCTQGTDEAVRIVDLLRARADRLAGGEET